MCQSGQFSNLHHLLIEYDLGQYSSHFKYECCLDHWLNDEWHLCRDATQHQQERLEVGDCGIDPGTRYQNNDSI